MSFKFQMEGFYKLKREQEREAQIELGKLIQQKNEMQNELQTIINAHKSWEVFYNQVGGESGREKDRMLVEHYLAHLDRREQMTNEQIRLKDIEIEKALELVKIAYKAKRQIEILREKKQEEYKEEMRIIELRELSEINTIRFIRQREENHENT